jgi:Xaa-Pro aminopeptidase
MVLSNEPGFYADEAYGIRIENLVLAQDAGVCRETGKDMVSFETLTLARYDDRLIIDEMLDAAEHEWLKNYHARLDDVLRKHG